MNLITCSNTNFSPIELGELAIEAEEGGYEFVKRSMQEYQNGKNRFDQEGEIFLVVKNDQQEIVGQCGLNHDPYLNQTGVYRLRHLYVSHKHRQAGIGDLLLLACIAHGRKVGAVCITLRTRNPIAASFYEKRGFLSGSTRPEVTHFFPIHFEKTT
ncbi:GNAT family N-acetyltransferase [Brevibacillus daliensis]|uniref:GNAT family N-acetyltransferase n=1 Tax=Brevibacillus daliensis TaxID=2892995 RepID=UPI001E3E4338|nr:GNAT family N-acetyltransferase [Brevibacillus daliensis]